MKRTLAIPAIFALTLTACSGNGSNDSHVSTPEAAPATVSSFVPEKGDQETKLGETNTLTCKDANYPCEVDFVISEIYLNETCPDGIADYMDGSTHQDDEIYITIIGESEVKEVTWSDGFSLSGSFGVRDVDGFTHEATTAHGCNYDVFEEWGDVRRGDKGQGKTTLLIPSNSTELLVRHIHSPESYSYDLTAISVGEGGAVGAPRWTTPEPQPTDPVIGITEAPGAQSPQPLGKQIQECLTGDIYQTGTTVFTDGTTGWTEYCAAQ